MGTAVFFLTGWQSLRPPQGSTHSGLFYSTFRRGEKGKTLISIFKSFLKIFSPLHFAPFLFFSHLDAAFLILTSYSLLFLLFWFFLIYFPDMSPPPLKLRFPSFFGASVSEYNMLFTLSTVQKPQQRFPIFLLFNNFSKAKEDFQYVSQLEHFLLLFFYFCPF